MRKSGSLRALLSLLLLVLFSACVRGDEPRTETLGTHHDAVIRSFAVGSLVIPMDNTYQNNGTLKAFGLVYRLLSNGIPVHWTIQTGKAAGAVDFTASGTNLQTGAVITSYGYKGGPFIIDAADRTAALPFITAWHLTNVTTVHSMTAAFSADVRRTLTAAPRIAVFVDGNEIIAFRYLNAAGIPDSTGKAWPVAAAVTYPTFPDVLQPAAIRGTALGGTPDGALLRTDGTPAWCQITSMHYNAPADNEVVREVRAWLASGPSTHAFMECEATQTFENSTNGHFLTTNGIVDDGATPTPLTNRVPDSAFAQLDGTFAAVNGSTNSIGLATGSTFYTSDVVLFNLSTAPTTQRIVWMTGNLDGDTTKGKVSYLAGHEYTTTLPISTNASTNGVRLFLNSLFESNCASSTGAPALTFTKSAPATTSGSTITFTLAYSNAGPGVADSVVITDTVPTGTTFVSATAGGTLAAGVVTWTIGNLKAGASGSVSFTVSVATDGTYTNTAKLAYKVSLTPKSLDSNTTSTIRSTVVPDAGTDTGTDTGVVDTGSADTSVTDTGGAGDTSVGDTTDAALDSDGDGLTDIDETAAGTNPFDADSDDDGVPDGSEPKWNEDTDGDGLINALDPDSDDDGLYDGTELGLGCDGKDTDKSKKHCRADADAGKTKTDPLKKDTDGGGVSDGSEDANLDGAIDAGETDPTTGHGSDDATVVDTDKDGLSDALEKFLGSNPNDADSDDDGLPDGEESNPSDDTDGDGKINVLDPDSDGDGLFDGTERGKGCGDSATDTSKGTCIADADPSTKTGVLTPDTDKGGVKDGDEDTNHNGKIDPGERDPNDPKDDFPVTDGGTDGGIDGSIDATSGDTGGNETGVNADDGTLEGGGCGCTVPGTSEKDDRLVLPMLLGAALLVVRRRRHAA